LGKGPWRGAVGALLCAAAVVSAEPSAAQREPAFRTDCAGLAARLEALKAATGEEPVIEVRDQLRYVGSDDAVAYLGLCEPPAPRVLCVTYKGRDWKVGETVLVSGAFTEGRPGYLKIDPCLHLVPEATPAR